MFQNTQLHECQDRSAYRHHGLNGLVYFCCPGINVLYLFYQIIDLGCLAGDMICLADF